MKKIVVLTLLVLCGAVFPYFVLRKAPERPDIILISIDTLRADHLGCYGYTRDTSPNIDAFAGESLLYERAYAPTCWTAPSHMTMFTSLLPCVHTVEDHPIPKKLDQKIKTLPQYLKAEGYSCYGVYYGSYLAPEVGFGKGFDHYKQVGFIAPAADEIKEILEKKREKGKPMFLFIHVGDVHQPYMEPNEYNKKDPELVALYDKDYEGSVKTGSEQDALEVSQRMWRGEDVSRDRDRMIALYDAAIRHTDEYLNKIFKLLKANGAYRNSAIIFTSDHGEEFGEHNAFGHNQLYEEAVRVPMIIKRPHRSVVEQWRDKAAGRIIPRVVRLLDIMPTALEFARVRGEYVAQGLPLDEALGGAGKGSREAFTETRMDNGKYKVRRGIVREDYSFQKQYFNRPADGRAVQYKLYDKKDDRTETADISGKMPEVVASFDKRLAEIESETADLRERVLKVRGTSAKMNKEQMDWLRSVGYLH